MSGQLEAYTDAKQAAVLAALEMLAAERRLAKWGTHVAGLLVAEEALDVAAAKLAAAVDGLLDGSNRKPVGWDKPADPPGAVLIARHLVAKAALRCLMADYGDETADADSEAEYAEELLALACRNLAADVEAQKSAKEAAS